MAHTFGIWTTEEIEEALKDEVGVEDSGSWDEARESCPAEYDRTLTLKKFTMHDDRVTLKFTNGWKVRIFHPAEGPKAYDGDAWDVRELGWSYPA